MQLLLNEEFLPFATQLIANARHSVDISTFKAEHTTKPRGKRLLKLFDTLITNAKAGIPVRFLISKRECYGHIPLTNLYAVRLLKANRVQVRHLRNDRLCHAKIIIIDSRYAIIGSHNLSIKSCHNNFETSVFFDDEFEVKQLIAAYSQAFDNAKEA